MSAKVLIVEDDIIIATDIRQMLTYAGYQVTGIANDYFKGLRLFRDNLPDLIVCDISLRSKRSGIDFVVSSHKIKKVPVIYLTGLVDEATLDAALQTTPDSYLTKPFTEPQLMVAVKRILYSNGKSGLFPEEEISAPTKREHQIIKCIANGFSSKEIADLLTLSFETIQTHRKRIFKKYKVHSSAEMVALALRNHWLS